MSQFENNRSPDQQRRLSDFVQSRGQGRKLTGFACLPLGHGSSPGSKFFQTETLPKTDDLRGELIVFTFREHEGGTAFAVPLHADQSLQLAERFVLVVKEMIITNFIDQMGA